ncbi:MAG: BCCT family transporter, partial [Brachybacterium alimentarium]
PPRITRIFWASASGVIAASLIWVSSLSGDADASGMTALQSLALLSALPFSIVMIGMCISLWRSLSHEVKVIEKLELRLRQREFMERYTEEITDEVTDRVTGDIGDHVESHLEGPYGQQIQDQLNQQVEAQVAEQLSTYTAEHPAISLDGEAPAESTDPGSPEPGRPSGSGRRKSQDR